MPRLLIWRHSLPALSFNLPTVGFAARLRSSRMRKRGREAPRASLGLGTRAAHILGWERVGVENGKSREAMLMRRDLG